MAKYNEQMVTMTFNKRSNCNFGKKNHETPEVSKASNNTCKFCDRAWTANHVCMTTIVPWRYSGV